MNYHSYEVVRPKRRGKPRNYEEDSLQGAVCAVLRFKPAKDMIFFAVPNGEPRSLKTGAKLKRLGLLAGVPDLVVIVGSRLHFLELKSKKGTLSPEQRAFRVRCQDNGIPHEVCRTYDQVEDILLEWRAITGRANRRAA